MPLVELASTTSGCAARSSSVNMPVSRAPARGRFPARGRHPARFPTATAGRDAGQDRFGFIGEQTGLTQFGQPLGDEGHARRWFAAGTDPRGSPKPGAGEDDGPGSADQAGSDDGDFGHAAISCCARDDSSVAGRDATGNRLRDAASRRVRAVRTEEGTHDGNKTKVAVLDDWQGVAPASADWSRLKARADVVFFPTRSPTRTTRRRSWRISTSCCRCASARRCRAA